MTLAEIKARLEERSRLSGPKPTMEDFYWILTHLEASLTREAELLKALEICDILLRDDKLCDPEVLSEEEIRAWNSAKETLAAHSKALEELA